MKSTKTKQAKNKKTSSPEKENDMTLITPCECDRFLSESDIVDFGITKKCYKKENYVPIDDCNLDFETEYSRLRESLNLPTDTYSLTRIELNLPTYVKYDFRSACTHMHMSKFSTVSRGHQGPAIGVSAIATSVLIDPYYWNESIIDQVIDDGDIYYNTSYKRLEMDDQNNVRLLDLKRDLIVRKTHQVTVKIDIPIYAGRFRSEYPKDLHVAEALDLFFQKSDTCVLTSPVLNIAIWKGAKCFYIFDGNARLDNCEIANADENGTAKLILVQNLTGVLFIIFEKSNVKNEYFDIHEVTVVDVKKISELDEDEKSLTKPKRRPSGHLVSEKFRAIVQGHYHLYHPILPREFQGKGHLVIAVAALVYSKLVSSNKWRKIIIDLIFNQANIYLTDLVRVLGKTLADSFDMTLNDLLCDIILGVYTAKIKVQENVIPGKDKGKLTIDEGLRVFFATHYTGILEMKRIFYAIWKEKDKFYLFDPFACNSDGFRVDSSDPDQYERYKKAGACVTMNSSINELTEIILENTKSTDKDPFVIHDLNVLYVKTETIRKGSDENVVFRQEHTNRKPPRSPSLSSKISDECTKVIDILPRSRKKTKLDVMVQYPEMMDQVELFIDTVDESSSKESSRSEPLAAGYRIVNPNRLMLKGSKNCMNRTFSKKNRGKQGLVIALAAIAQAERINATEWCRNDIDNIIHDACVTYEKLVSWILLGSPENGLEETGPKNANHEYANGKLTARNFESSSHNFNDKLLRELDHLDLSMLPKKIKVGDNLIGITSKMNIAESEANPLANLGEVLDQYFKCFDDTILENKKLIYGIWKRNKKYFVLNPYGSNREGWRNNLGTATLIVVDSINELVNVLYGLLEFNDSHFFLHFVKVKLVNQDENNNDINGESVDINTLEISKFGKYRTTFIPVTDENLVEVEPTLEEDKYSAADVRPEERKSTASDRQESVQTVKIPSTNQKSVQLFESANEPEQLDAPSCLNFALITGIVKIEDFDETEEYKEPLEIFYEKLKYQHPPPFVEPPRKNLCDLSKTKKASESMHSLLSRSSIDSRLAVNGKVDISPENERIQINSLNDTKKIKLITLPSKKYFISLSLPSGLTPIRAIDDKFIRDTYIEEDQEQECRNRKTEKPTIMVRDDASNVEPNKNLPVIIPLGPCIMTPEPKSTKHGCPEKKSKKCALSEKEQEDIILRKLVCSTEDLILEMILPDFRQNDELERSESVKGSVLTNVGSDDGNEKYIGEAEPCGFEQTDDADVGIISANMSLEDRATVESKYYKSCYFSAIFCILAKINVSVNEFRSSFLDRFILAAKKINSGTGKLSYKMTRWFRNFDILGAKYNVIVKQVRYADPENYEPDALKLVLWTFLEKHQTGIVSFGNISWAFWVSSGIFYLFDPYVCDKNGKASVEGSGCLLEFCNYEKFIERVIENKGEASDKPYRLYSIAISHLENTKKKKCKKSKKRKKHCEKPDTEHDLDSDKGKCDSIEEQASDTSLIELSEWLDKSNIASPDPAIPGFQPVKGYNASALEVTILKNEITRPTLAPLKYEAAKEPIRETPYDRKFYENSVLAEPMFLCMMAWSQIHDPTSWSIRTIKALYRASTEYALDSLLTSEDSSVPTMTDDLLTEFGIANYIFRVVFAPMHSGVLYANEGWNLAMSLEKIFGSPIYTGAVLVCDNTHIGVMKQDEKYYAWWLIKHTKDIRIIVSEDMEDYLKLIVKEINQPEETEFMMRIVTVSYAKMYGPNCSDIEGLHESVVPSCSIAEIHRKESEGYDIESIFKQIDHSRAPIVVFGSTALRERALVIEPSIKRCYFVALFAVILKRDITQNPLPGMIDKILELADLTYKLFEEPRYHTEHILKDIYFMERIFDIRDCASHVVSLLDDNGNIDRSLFTASVTKQIKQLFKKCDGGIIHFSNCCYGFWYSKTTKCYYYLDPYQCDTKGKVVHLRGKSCIFIFSNVRGMVRQMSHTQLEDTTGFFIHQIHVESVNTRSCIKFQEDPIWNYIDYHWCYAHVPKSKKQKIKICQKQDATKEIKKRVWKNYLIEVPNLIYSLWGTLGTFDPKFGVRACKNQAAICVAVFAMQNLCHPSEWDPVVLDSAVMCGDSYYKESKKSSEHCLNSFNLSRCLRVSPYIWNIEFREGICGILYGNSDQPNLTDSLGYAFQTSTNLLLKCEKKILAILKTSDAFYAVDSSWTGIPLFSKRRGAIYTIRCQNMNILVYVLTKMLNTNLKLEFTIIPVKIVFEQETCQLSDAKPNISRKNILSKPVYIAPGQTLDHSTLVTGSNTFANEGCYLTYKRNLKIGLTRDAEIGAQIKLSCQTKEGMVKMSSKEKVKSCRKGSQIIESYFDEFEKNVGHPQVINLVKYDQIKEQQTDGLPFSGQKSSCQKNHMDVRRSFIEEETRKIYERYNVELKKDIYATYKHKNTKAYEQLVQIEETAPTQSDSTTINVVLEDVDVKKTVQIVDEVNEEFTEENKISNEEGKVYRSSIHLDIGEK